LLEKRQYGKPKSMESTDGYGTILSAILARPLHVPFILFVLGIASMGFSINNLFAAIFFQMIMSSLNDLSVTLLNELIGTSLPANEFKYYQGLGQWLRRLGNMVTGVSGPILFDIYKPLPFILFGALVFTWALVLWRLMYVHANNCELSNTNCNEEYNKRTRSLRNTRNVRGGNFEPIKGLFRPFLATIIFPWHVLEQKYYAENKDDIEEKLNKSKKLQVDLSMLEQKLQVDISMLEHRVRRMGAALTVEQSRRRALEDRIYAAQSHQGKEKQEV